MFILPLLRHCIDYTSQADKISDDWLNFCCGGLCEQADKTNGEIVQCQKDRLDKLEISVS